MLCALDDFYFTSGGVNLASIKRSLKFDYDNSKTISHAEQWQATGTFSQTINLAGMLIKKSNSTLDALQELAKKKKTVTLTFDNGEALSVLILSIEKDQSSFLKNGMFLKQGFSVELGVVYDEL